MFANKRNRGKNLPLVVPRLTLKSAPLLCLLGGGSVLLAGCTGNALPEWTSASDVVVQSKEGGLVYTAHATDADGDLVTYGTAGALPDGWSLNANTGELFAPVYTGTGTPEVIAFDLAAFDGSGGATLLPITVSFSWPAPATALNITFPPNNSHINLAADESITVLFNSGLKYEGGVDNTIVSAMLSAGEDTVALELGDDGITWQGDFQLPAGDITLTGEVTFSSGDVLPFNEHILHVNQYGVQGLPAEGQVQAGHQLDIAARKLYYMQGGVVYSRHIDTGVTKPLWQGEYSGISYFGVGENEASLYLLQEVNTGFNYSELFYNFNAGNMLPGLVLGLGGSAGEVAPSSPSNLSNTPADPTPPTAGGMQWVLSTVDLVSGLVETSPLSDTSEILSLAPAIVEFNSNKNTFLVNLYGVGGGGSATSDPNGGESITTSFIEITNIIFELDVLTKETTPLLFGSNDGLSGGSNYYFADAQDEKIFQFDFEQQALAIKTLADNQFVDNYSVNGFALGQMASDADFIASADDFGEVLVSVAGVAGFDNDFSVPYGDLVVFTEGSQYRTITNCNTSLLATLPYLPDAVMPYPKSCINGIPYDLTVDAPAGVAYVSALNVVPPADAVLIGDDTFSNAPYFYRNIHAVSLKTGDVSTVFSGY